MLLYLMMIHDWIYIYYFLIWRCTKFFVSLFVFFLWRNNIFSWFHYVFELDFLNNSVNVSFLFSWILLIWIDTLEDRFCIGDVTDDVVLALRNLLLFFGVCWLCFQLIVGTVRWMYHCVFSLGMNKCSFVSSLFL